MQTIPVKGKMAVQVHFNRSIKNQKNIRNINKPIKYLKFENSVLPFSLKQIPRSNLQFFAVQEFFLLNERFLYIDMCICLTIYEIVSVQYIHIDR